MRALLVVAGLLWMYGLASSDVHGEEQAEKSCASCSCVADDSPLYEEWTKAPDHSESENPTTTVPIGFLGRADANSRFNIYDNMSPIPATRLWFNYRYLDGFRTGLERINNGAIDKRQVSLYRLGVEVAASDRLSVVFQHEYIASAGTTAPDDAWGAPQFALMYVLLHTEMMWASSILGIQPEVSTSPGELHETTTRLTTGIISCRAFGERLFLQGGFQFGFSSNDLSQTFDHAISAGYWLYRHPSLEAPSCCSCNQVLRAVVPQIELFGRHVYANSRATPFDTRPGTVFTQELRHVYDLTIGGRLLLFDRVQMAVGYSFPLSGDYVRDDELMTYLNFAF